VLIYIVAIFLIGSGIYGILTARHLICTIACLSVAQSGTYLILLGIGFVRGAAPPIATPAIPAAAVDPIVQALTLTDVVVSAAVTALLLSIAVEIFKRTGTLDPERLAAAE